MARRFRKSDRAHEAGHRCEIARQANHATATTEGREIKVFDRLSGQCDGRQVDEVTQVRQVPIETRRVSDDSERIVENRQLPF